MAAMSGPAHLSNIARQRVLDAALGVQESRHRALATLDGAETGPGVHLVARGDLSSWTLTASATWRHLLSTRSAATAEQLMRSLPNNRRRCAAGLTMISVFDHESTEQAARRLLEAEPPGAYFYAYAPVQIKIVDRRSVLLQGPTEAGMGSLLELTDDRAVSAAWSYWRALMATAVPCRGAAHPPRLTDRQVQILELLRLDATDERIGRLLGLSVRTVRTDIGAAMAALGVRSRFAAGYAFAMAQEPHGA
ncbi:helix-turn-helix transcriptional regulator [Tersicoccus sp. Bi-70]|uniref:helix-turn-helix transcriptional regulator n=1 Tax=Tersicoccus sp. Bi-70 TaxID=1897634 RepID=UPI0009F8ECFC|nr:helix-turn-helix transcriptional regulator [Tersicoccus sp. Bi-70]